MNRDWQQDVEDGLCLGEHPNVRESLWSTLVSGDPRVVRGCIEGQWFILDDGGQPTMIWGPANRVPEFQELLDILFGDE